MKNRDTSFRRLTKQALEGYFSGINECQRRAVFHMDGPLLILAGAGSGKTTVIINRIENMILFGDAYHNGREDASPEDIALVERYLAGGDVPPRDLANAVGAGTVRPWNILAITFTNKAAGELRTRLEERLGDSVASDVMASTFHSLCARILRRDAEQIGYGRSFTIYDADDSMRVVKDCLKQAGVSDKLFPPKSVMGSIGRAKDSLWSPADALGAAGGDFRAQTIAKIYGLYAKALKSANAMDFDDLIYQTVMLLRRNPETLSYYRGRWRYVMVDEYQDTNHAQYELISLLAGGHGNLCVVGDDDQSIYKFRGATIENILSFEEQFPGTEVIRLEQNYRSTGNILTSANEVIAHNTARKGKNLWTSSGEGEKVLVERVWDEEAESRLIAAKILENVKNGAKFSDHAVLYRMNAQSSAVEQALARNAIPYRIIGGLRFYERKEIKDMVAYLTVLYNPADNLRLSRIIGVPKRNIGAATISAAQEIADTLGQSLFSVLEESDRFAPLQKKSTAVAPFVELIKGLTRLVEEEEPLDVVLEQILERSGYRMMLEAEGLEGTVRMENILELKSNLIRYQNESPEPSLSGFLEEIALYTDLDNYDAGSDSVVLMTIHAAKGLEFEHVFIAGMDEGIFPGRSVMINPAEVEEERRLAYVAITRAKKELVITTAGKRLFFGQTIYGQPSRFIGELPESAIIKTDRTARPSTATRPAAAPSGRSKGAATSISVGKEPEKASGETFATGDTVSHKVFGEGHVLSVKPMGGDILLEISFNGVGIKKIMANYAHLYKTNG